MKRSKILIPTLSALAVTPAIALVGCNQGDSEEQKILDAIFKPISLQPASLPKATFEESYVSLSDSEKKEELLYDLFGLFNDTATDGTSSFIIRDLYLNKNEGAFKINIPECDIYKKDSQHLASFRGYISYIFGKQHKILMNEVLYTFEENDYIMITYDFTDAIISPKEADDCYYFQINPRYGNCLGNMKWKFDGGKKEALFTIFSIDTSDNENSPTNSKNWVVNKK